MNILKITKCKNGYVLELEDEQGKPLDRCIANNDNLRGYSKDALVTAIEYIFADNTPNNEKTTKPDADIPF